MRQNSTAAPSVATIRGDFPILQRQINGRPLAYLDNAATTQKPRAVIDALVNFYERHNANTHSGVHTLSEEATALYEEARARAARFLNAPSPRCIVFTQGTTAAINLVAQGWARHHLRQGDEIVLTVMEHHSNLLPWLGVARETGAVLRYLEIDGEGRLTATGREGGGIEGAVSRATRLVAVTHVSNVLGTINPVKELARQARAVGACVVVDAAQSAPHLSLDVQALDRDFLAFSSHKVYGPTGIGVLYGKEEYLAAMEPPASGGGMVLRVERHSYEWMEPPWRFEAGTPNIAGAVAMGAALDYLDGFDREMLRRHEIELTGYALKVLGKRADLTLYGPADPAGRAGVIPFSVGGVHPHDVVEVLDGQGVAVRGGHHCCQPLMEHLGERGVVRVSLALYNERQDIDQLAHGLDRVAAIFRNDR